METKYEARPGTFSLFKNQDKKTEKHPDYKGDGKDLDGNDIWVSAWLKDSKVGKFMSCSFKLKDEQAKPSKHNDDTPIDDIPF